MNNRHCESLRWLLLHLVVQFHVVSLALQIRCQRRLGVFSEIGQSDDVVSMFDVGSTRDAILQVQPVELHSLHRCAFLSKWRLAIVGLNRLGALQEGLVCQTAAPGLVLFYPTSHLAIIITIINT